MDPLRSIFNDGIARGRRQAFPIGLAAGFVAGVIIGLVVKIPGLA